MISSIADGLTEWLACRSGEYESMRPVLNEALELQVLQGLDAQNGEEIAAVIKTITDSGSLSEFRRVVGGWLEVVVGRGAPTAAEAAVLQPIVSAMVESAGVSGKARRDKNTLLLLLLLLLLFLPYSYGVDGKPWLYPDRLGTDRKGMPLKRRGVRLPVDRWRSLALLAGALAARSKW
jgi:hypothetical protein